MAQLSPPALRACRRGCYLAGALTALALLPTVPASGQKLDVLRIGTTGSLTPGKAADEKGALKTLQNFIREETGLNNDIVRQEGWQQLAERMAQGALQVGVFQGFEFAWARAKQPALKPLALAVNVNRYPVVYVVTRTDDKASNFAGLQGQTLGLPEENPGLLHLFVQHECQAGGKSMAEFFGKVVVSDSAEDALDDCVDGTVQAAAAERAALEAFKRRKPGRFRQLKAVAHSQPLPPTVIAIYDNNLDPTTLKVFETGLLNAANSDRGQTLLTLFHLTGFERVPNDFEQVLSATRKAYPPTNLPTDPKK